MGTHTTSACTYTDDFIQSALKAAGKHVMFIASFIYMHACNAVLLPHLAGGGMLRDEAQEGYHGQAPVPDLVPLHKPNPTHPTLQKPPKSPAGQQGR